MHCIGFGEGVAGAALGSSSHQRAKRRNGEHEDDATRWHGAPRCSSQLQGLFLHHYLLGRCKDFEGVLPPCQCQVFAYLYQLSAARHPEMSGHVSNLSNGSASAKRLDVKPCSATKPWQPPRGQSEQTVAKVGEGHFHRASASTTSLRGAFRAVTQTQSGRGWIYIYIYLCLFIFYAHIYTHYTYTHVYIYNK